VKKIFLLMLLAGLAACSSQPPVPANRFYQLSAPNVKAVSSTQQQVLLVRRPTTSGIYNERSILYINQNKPLAIKRYHYHLWAQPPSILLRDYVVTYLRQAGAFSQVLTRRVSSAPVSELNIYIKHFEHVLNGNKAKVIVELEMDYRHAGKHQVKTFRAEAAAGDTSLHTAAKTFARALSQIMESMLVIMK